VLGCKVFLIQDVGCRDRLGGVGRKAGLSVCTQCQFCQSMHVWVCMGGVDVAHQYWLQDIGPGCVCVEWGAAFVHCTSQCGGGGQGVNQGVRWGGRCCAHQCCGGEECGQGVGRRAGAVCSLGTVGDHWLGPSYKVHSTYTISDIGVEDRVGSFFTKTLIHWSKHSTASLC
jgi:hypothetical protein